MELDPLGVAPEQLDERRWLVSRMATDHSITVLSCPDLLGSGDHSQSPHLDELLMLTLMGEYKFLLEHQEVRATSELVFDAGLNSARIGYRHILMKEPTARWESLDLVEHLELQEVAAYVERAMMECKVADYKL